MAFTYSAVQAQTPSKKETMDWIAEKMKQYLLDPRVFQSYENGIFIYQKRFFLEEDDDSPRGRGYAINTIDLNKVGSFMCGPCEGDRVVIHSISGNNIIKTISYERGQYKSTEYGNSLRTSDHSEEPMFNFSLDYYLGARMYKALNNLQKYNGNSGNEAY